VGTALLPGRFLYLGNPRTASTTVGKALVRELGAVPQQQHATTAEVPTYAGEPRFTTVRNPFDVLVSWYVRMRMDQQGTPFAEFLRTYENRDFVRDGRLFWQCEEGVEVTYYEHLQHDLEETLRRLGVRTVLLRARENATPRKKPWRDYYDDEAVEAANHRFGHVADRWGYERL
jgi:hypothetical protein